MLQTPGRNGSHKYSHTHPLPIPSLASPSPFFPLCLSSLTSSALNCILFSSPSLPFFLIPFLFSLISHSYPFLVHFLAILSLSLSLFLFIFLSYSPYLAPIQHVSFTLLYRIVIASYFPSPHLNLIKDGAGMRGWTLFTLLISSCCECLP